MSTTTQDRVAPAARTRVVLLATLVVAVVVGGTIWHLVSAAPKAPYTDPSAVGHLTICTTDGKAVTSGSTTQALGAVVVSDAAAPAAYAGTGRTASLMVAQPRKGAEPEEWTGLQLNAATGYDSTDHPATTLDATSTTIGQFVRGYPAIDDGWLQLRLVLGAAGAAEGRASYAAGDLHVDGTTWTLSDPGTAPCP